MKRRNVGRGEHYSIPKAALIHFYEFMNTDGRDFVIMHDLPDIHAIVEIAGAQHIGPDTPYAVISSISSSPYWRKDGYMNTAYHPNTYVPTDKGRKYYDEHLKHRGREEDERIKRSVNKQLHPPNI